MKAHFAIIKSLTSRYSNQSIVEVHEATDGMPNDRTISPCGRFFTYGVGYMFKSDVVTIELDEIDDFEREIDACDDAIRGLTSAMYKRLETELEVPKARKLELQQLVHMPAVDVTYPEPQKEQDAEFEGHPLFNPDPDDSPMDEEFEAIQDRDMLDELIREDMNQHEADDVFDEGKPATIEDDDHLFDDAPYSGMAGDEEGI